MDSESINWINLNLQNVNKDINNKIHNLNNFAKILLLGDSETGKTTLKNILLNKKCYVYKNEFDDVELKFIDNDDANNDDKTQLISIDYNSKLIFCECPPLKSDDGLNEEILNSLIIDSIIQAHSKNNRNFMKILLIISAPEFESGRGRGILKKICRIYRMFPQTEKMKDGFGLVITKGIEECRGKVYLKRLQERSPDDLKQICDFFLINKNKVFVLPKPSKAKIGCKYEFDDHDSLQNFIMDEYIEDPITKVTLSDYSESELKGILLRQSQQRDTIINEIFSKMAELYQKETNNDYSLWKNIILQMNDIDCVNDLRTYIENNIPEIPNMPNFVYNFQTLDKYQNIHDSINILFKKGNDSNFIKDILLQNVLKATRQIDILYSNSQEIKLKDELNKALDKKKDTLCGILQKGQNILDECSITNEEPQKEQIVIDESLLTNEEPHNKQIKIDESFLTNDEKQKEQIVIDESFLTNDEQQKDNQNKSRDKKFANNVVVNGDPKEVENLLGFDSFNLFKELKTSSKCDSVLKEVKNCLVETEDIEKTGQLLYLAGELNSLREFWAWLKGIDPKTLNVEQIFSEDGPEDQDLGADKKLIFLRDVSWGEGVVDESGNEGLRKKCGALRAKCKGFI